MEFLNKLNLKPAIIFKVAGLVLAALLGIILLTLVFRVIGSSFGSVTRQGLEESAGGFNMLAYDSDGSKASFGAAAPELSARNIAPMPPYEETVTGDRSEDYEVTQYSGTIETRDLDGTCGALAALKTKDYVIFESANEYDRGCNYNFKVERSHKDEILETVKGLDPKTLVENTNTIKRQIDDFTSETEILTKKKESIERTLSDAIASYDEIARVATQARDAESLAKIIDSKIRIIERLSQDRISVNEQLDRLSRAKAEQLDRLDYTYFYLSVYENKFVDGENIKDSWKAAVKEFVRDVNITLQTMSIGLLAAILLVIQYALYIFLLILAAKYGWRFVRYIWNK
ncbi:hypothetical protein A2303_00455 [Candidatus Falkowbacteria bacterium RIFOXYB2_FULL_47_14]|uniref:DUF4349 domain-containing protein n=1 Tax=Candidatus Falkowbacteria bacterium RIFOXYA2_FULL_47_19 TaxID=1797994 RepID=A0A1F5SMC9_9BACT|nr:MAG: hypothetical protein A2227_03860 [Candidatus Falkowbacteria bacterium RIFOXYA2_FULL_47_19]OGF37346.1 MAG: hypothetical protein A2468_02220 [Candidatus Falkowbacteria bacterium RIFOXYC2_FULL_46_15]OGF42848.1 MAG: hypothetical protein A2303_00455 [Candidatus Falkowbacteria bacterium RIFOXYB2_FULL_47_14]